MTLGSSTLAVALRATLVAGVALLLAGCQARLALDVAVTPDGTGELSVTLAADEALLAESAAAGVDPLDELAAAGRALTDDGWTVTETTGAEGDAVTLTTAFAGFEEFNELAATLAEALAAPEVRLVDRLALRTDDGLWRFEGAVGAVPQPAVDELGLAPDEAVALVLAHDAFAFEVTAQLPGELVESNAGDPGMPLRWDVRPGERVELLAVVEPPTPPWWRSPLAAAAAAAGAAAALLAIGLVWVARRRRRRRHLRFR